MVVLSVQLSVQLTSLRNQQKVEIASGEERAPAESLGDEVNLQAADMVPSREAEMVPAKMWCQPQRQSSIS